MSHSSIITMFLCISVVVFASGPSLLLLLLILTWVSVLQDDSYYLDFSRVSLVVSQGKGPQCADGDIQGQPSLSEEQAERIWLGH